MERLSKNFTRNEFACQGENCCSHSAPLHPDLIDGVQALRDEIGCALNISSGFRCRTHNKAIGGKENSFHTLGMACDILIPNSISAKQFSKMTRNIAQFENGGIGVYKSFIHVDVRNNGPANWTG
jgi:uncharacterized protein YcbK (DUF882 family)